MTNADINLEATIQRKLNKSNAIQSERRNTQTHTHTTLSHPNETLPTHKCNDITPHPHPNLNTHVHKTLRSVVIPQVNVTAE